MQQKISSVHASMKNNNNNNNEEIFFVGILDFGNWIFIGIFCSIKYVQYFIILYSIIEKSEVRSPSWRPAVAVDKSW